jgi:hypothetical protein
MNDTVFDYSGAAAVSTGTASFPFFTILVIGGVLLIALIAALIVARKLLFQPELHGLSKEAIQARWAEIEKVADTGVMGAKMAVMEADKLLDGALKSMGMAGATLGERLKFASYKYPELRKVWNAHRLRNQLVHETSFEISQGQARSAIHDYKRALKTLHVL